MWYDWLLKSLLQKATNLKEVCLSKNYTMQLVGVTINEWTIGWLTKNNQIDLSTSLIAKEFHYLDGWAKDG